MYNKNLIYFISIVIILLSFLLTVFMDEKVFCHSFSHLFLLVVVMLSLFISMKTIFNVIMIYSAFIWALTFFDILSMTPHLLFETIVMLFCGILLGWYEINFKHEKKEIELIMSYKRKENEKLQQRVNEENKINEELMNEIKEYRKKLVE